MKPTKLSITLHVDSWPAFGLEQTANAGSKEHWERVVHEGGEFRLDMHAIAESILEGMFGVGGYEEICADGIRLTCREEGGALVLYFEEEST